MGFLSIFSFASSFFKGKSSSITAYLVIGLILILVSFGIYWKYSSMKNEIESKEEKITELKVTLKSEQKRLIKEKVEALHKIENKYKNIILKKELELKENDEKDKTTYDIGSTVISF